MSDKAPSLISRFMNLARAIRDEIKTFVGHLRPQVVQRFDFANLDGERLLICAHYDIHEKFDPAFLFLIENLKQQLRAKVMVVSTNLNISKTEIEKISSKVDCLILRNNFGRDFGSWKLGLSLIPNIQKYQSLILANDTVYGPFQSLENFLGHIEVKTKAAIGGMTDFYGKSSQLKSGHLESGHLESYHLQSYFLIFNQACLKTKWFGDYWQNYRNHYGRLPTIRNGELGLSKSAKENQIELVPLFPYHEIHNYVLKNQKPLEAWREHMNLREVNPYHFFWRELIEKFNYPFIKIELLRFNPAKIPNLEDYKAIVQKTSRYPVDLIEAHVNRVRPKKLRS